MNIKMGNRGRVSIEKRRKISDFIRIKMGGNTVIAPIAVAALIVFLLIGLELVASGHLLQSRNTDSWMCRR